MNFSKTQWFILIAGVLLTLTSIYGKIEGWEKNDVFIFFFTGTNLMWISTLDSKKSSCCKQRKERMEKTKTI